jgi:hypothetical protein
MVNASAVFSRERPWFGAKNWWAEKDLNPRPHAYQACALTLSYQPIHRQPVGNGRASKAKTPLPERTVLVRESVHVRPMWRNQAGVSG